MTSYTAFTLMPGEAAAYALGDAMERLTPTPTGIGVFEVEDGSGRWEVSGFFTEQPDRGGLALLSALHGAEFAVSTVEDRDWVAQVRRELTPVEAGRFVVHGTHDRDNIPTARIPLLIDAAMAFGTGHHGTTVGCLKALDRIARMGLAATNVIDVGTGTGVLAMAAARLWPARIVASDIDRVAVETARFNAVANGLGPRIACIHAPGLLHPRLVAGAPYDLLMANILARPLKRLAPDFAAVTAPGARVILSGILNRQAAGVVAVFKGHRMVLEHRIREGEWTTLTLERTV